MNEFINETSNYNIIINMIREKDKNFNGFYTNPFPILKISISSLKNFDKITKTKKLVKNKDKYNTKISQKNYYISFSTNL